jgi:hypothetical protein
MYVPLPGAAARALAELSRREHRHPRDQALVILIDGLRQRGLIPAEDEPATHGYGAPAAGGAHAAG